MFKAFLTMIAAATSVSAAAQPASPPPPAANQPRAAAPAPTGPYTLRGQLTFYEMTDFNGDSWMINGSSRAVETDWPIRSLSVHPGDRWQICGRSSFRDCIIIDRSVPDASAIGISNQIGSARPAPADAR